MNTKEIIDKLQELDPEGIYDVVALANDGYVYDIFHVNTEECNKGIIEEDSPNPNCVVLHTIN